MPKLQDALPTLLGKLWDMLKTSIGGFLGATGFCSVLFWSPSTYFFCSKKKPRIEERWTDYLPLRASPLKDEVAAVISQIKLVRCRRTSAVSYLSVWLMAFLLALP